MGELRQDFLGKCLTALAEQFKDMFPDGAWAFQIGGSINPGEVAVQLFTQRDDAITYFETYVREVELVGFDVLRERLLLNIDQEAPYEVAKVDVWQDIYLHTLSVIHYPPTTSQEHILKLVNLVSKEIPTFVWQRVRIGDL